MRAAEAGVEQHDACATLGGGVHSFRKAPMVTGQDGNVGTRTKPAPAPLVRQRVSPAVQIGETERTALIDQRDTIGVPSSGNHRSCPQEAVAAERA